MEYNLPPVAMDVIAVEVVQIFERRNTLEELELKTGPVWEFAKNGRKIIMIITLKQSK